MEHNISSFMPRGTSVSQKSEKIETIAKIFRQNICKFIFFLHIFATGLRTAGHARKPDGQNISDT